MSIATLPNNPTRYLKTKEAARYLRISAWKMRDLAQREKVPYVRLETSGPWIFDREDLDAFIAGKKTAVNDEVDYSYIQQALDTTA